MSYRTIDKRGWRALVAKHAKWLATKDHPNKRKRAGAILRLLSDHLFADVDINPYEFPDGDRLDLSQATVHDGAFLGCSFRSIDFNDCSLKYNKFYDCNFRNCSFADANLYGSEFMGSSLRECDFSAADGFHTVTLTRTSIGACEFPVPENRRDVYPALPLARTMIVPQVGEFTAWKLCAEEYLVKLLVPASAKRSNAPHSRKCRVSSAKVLAIYDAKGKPAAEAVSKYRPNFTYKVGKTVRPTEPFDTNRFQECTSGIHCYITKEEALAH